MTVAPASIDGKFVAALREAGLDDDAIDDAANVGFHFNFINRMADALDFTMLTDKQRQKTSKMLQFMGRAGGGPAPDPRWGSERPVLLDAARERLISVEGALEPQVRAAAEAFGARARDGIRDGAPELPAAFAPFAKKVALYPYKVIDEEIDELRASGLDDAGIFELTFATAFGAALAGLEHVIAAAG